MADTGQLVPAVDIQIITAALAMAFIASPESLLTATAVDAMQGHAPRTKYDRELAAGHRQHPLRHARVAAHDGRNGASSTNVLAGAGTRVSSMLHGVWILLFVAFLPGVMRMIPVSCLAAVLVYTGYKLMNLKAIQELKGYGRGEVAVYLATMGTVVCVDLLAGVLVGIALAMARLLYIFSRLDVRMDEDPETGRTMIHLVGAATFIRLPKIAAVLEQIEPSADVRIDCRGLSFIDHACLELLADWERQRTAAGGELVIDWDTLNDRRREPRTGGMNASTYKPSSRDDRPAPRKGPRRAGGAHCSVPIRMRQWARSPAHPRHQRHVIPGQAGIPRTARRACTAGFAPLRMGFFCRRPFRVSGFLPARE